MKIKSIELSGFRGFAQERYFNLDADTVILVGANGRGKTTLFDGILWALTGSIPRIGDGISIISKYSVSGEARVALTLVSENNKVCNIIRSFDGEAQRVRIEYNDEVFNEPLASTRLLEILWPDALLTSNSVVALTTAITRSVYLQQDLVRQFIEADTDQDRFKSVSELVGAGRVTELQLAVERARNAWSRATTTLEKDLESLNSRLNSLENRLGRLTDKESTGPKVDTVVIWKEWWSQAGQCGIEVAHVPSASSIEAPGKHDEALKQLGITRRSKERRIDLINELLEDIQSKSKLPLPEETALRKALGEAGKELQEMRQALSEAEARASEERKRQVELKESHEELQALAQLALRHLGSECPVCTQKYDKEFTRKRLENIVGTAYMEQESASAPKVRSLAADLQKLEQKHTAIVSELKIAEQAMKEQQRWMQGRDRRLRELEIEPDPDTNMVDILVNLLTDLKKSISLIKSLEEKGEELVLTLASAVELAQRVEIEKEIRMVSEEANELKKSLRIRSSTSDLAGQILNGLRDAAYFVVKKQLGRIEPLLQRIYATIDPHPSFRMVSFLTNFRRGRGLLDTEIKDLSLQIASDSPNTVLSSSQMNALAVALFLAFNLSVRSLPIHAAILDDPLQSLDDINLLGLIDLLRRVRDKRQLFVSTHDVRFGKLLERKLRPIYDKRTIIIEFTGWDREGPTFDVRESEPDRTPLRIIS